MRASPEPQCPIHRDSPTSAPAVGSAGSWPPGPPPGLTGWKLLRAMSRDLPGTLAAWRNAYGDVVHLRIWPEHDVVVADPQLARELLVSHHDALIRWERGIRVFSQVHGHSVLTAEGEAWRSRRHALLPSFSPKAVQRFSPSIVNAAARAFEQWPSENPNWPIEKELTTLTMDVILQLAFSSSIGEDVHAVEHAIRVTSEATNRELYWPGTMPDWMPWKRQKRRALRTLKDIIDRHIKSRLTKAPAAWPDDLLTRLLQSREDESEKSLRNVRDECMTTFLAGHETTAATLVWWAWCMASNLEAQRLARDELRRVLQGNAPSFEACQQAGYLVQTIKEAMRLYPVAPMLMSRRATRAIQLGDWLFPARTLFMIPVHSLHHDPRWFPDPETFRPERFAHDAPGMPRGAYIPFGVGPRVCLGQHLAMAEMTVLASMLLLRFELAVPIGAAPPRPVLNVTLRPDKPMHLAVSQVSCADGRTGS
ncbi:cytochrome P450 [Bordetella genomosp. 1]|uniref:Cytochrome P450 n=1 Tax=Bordetella genomosp. 1 TaxID=1395607 RepID=A0ABX4EZQ9_9BORD|nr:cytochrome P450 [Bordetella genomosp. 1]OZI58942.1 cytochrome P450 [Bordetella genomosp. 1]